MLTVGTCMGPSLRSAAHLRNLLVRRSASGFPPVWQVAQYCRLESANDTSRTTSPHTGHALPVLPCTARLDFFSTLSSLIAQPSARCQAAESTSRIAERSAEH